MKRLISFFLALLVVMTGFATVHASQVPLSDELATKLNIIKERIEDTSEYENFNAGKRNYNDKEVYNFEWYTEKDGVSKMLSISLNEEDVITNYYNYTGNKEYETKPTINKMSSKELADRTKDLIFELNPMLKDKIEIQAPKYDSLYNREYEFVIQRIENSLPVYGDNGYVSVSSDGKHILNFYINYTCGTNFPSDTNFISLDNAKEAYKNKLGLKLIYDIEYGEKRQRSAVLKYVCSEDSNTYISAVDGSIYRYLPQNGLSGGGSSKNMALTAEAAKDEVTFSVAESNEIEKIDNIIDIELLEKSLRENKYLNLDDELTLSNNSLSKDYYDENKYIYNLSFESAEGDNYCYITCDAISGNVISYRRYVPYSNNKDKEIIGTEYAKAAVSELAENYLSEDNDNSYRIVDEQDDYLRYVRYVNGVEVPSDTITIKISPNDGKIESYNVICNNLDFPEPANLVGLHDATEELFNTFKYSIFYLTDNTDGNAVPVYRFGEGSVEIDALTGIALNEPDISEISDYTDIEDHYAKEQIEILKRYGIGFAGGKFMPDKEITQGEYLALLSAVFSNWNSSVVIKDGYDYTNVYMFAERNNLLDRFSADESAVLTRSSACVLLVKAMGYDEPASFNDIYVTSFEDVTMDKGYISILNAMGVVNGDGNNLFYPQKTLTRAEAAKIIYNYLSR